MNNKIKYIKVKPLLLYKLPNLALGSHGFIYQNLVVVKGDTKAVYAKNGKQYRITSVKKWHGLVNEINLAQISKT